MFTIFDQLFADIEKQASSFGKTMESTFQKLEEKQKQFEQRFKNDALPNYKCDKGDDGKTKWMTETWTDHSGMYKFSRRVVKSTTSTKVEEEVTKPNIEELTAKMEDHAKNKRYEEAAKLRDIIEEIKNSNN